MFDNLFVASLASAQRGLTGAGGVNIAPDREAPLLQALTPYCS